MNETKTERSGLTLVAIVDTALAQALAEGLESLSLGELAKRLQLSKSGVFSRVGSREALQVAVIQEYDRRFLQDVFTPAMREPRGLPRLNAIMQLWLRRAADAARGKGCLYIAGSFEYDDREGVVRNQLLDGVRRWRAALRRCVLQAIEAGHLRADTDPDQIVFEMDALFTSLLRETRFLRDPAAATRTWRAGSACCPPAFPDRIDAQAIASACRHFARLCDKEPEMNTTQPNPAAAFFASPPARAIAALLRQLDRLAPQAGTRLALRLFLTPLPTKRLARRRPVPAGWRVEALAFEGSHVAVWRHEACDKGRPKVLLVHGWGGDAQQMLPLAAALHAGGFEPMLVDLPAHGHAGAWRSNLVQWTRALFALASRHGPWQAVVGHSLGARALAHALARGLPAQAAVLMAAAPPPRQFLGWFAAAVGAGQGLAERMARRIETHEGVAMHRFEPDWIGARLHQPTLLVHDRGDRTAPLSGSEALALALPAAHLVVTEGLGHRRVLSDPEVAAAVLAHLRT